MIGESDSVPLAAGGRRHAHGVVRRQDQDGFYRVELDGPERRA